MSIIKPLEGWLIGLGANVKQVYITETDLELSSFQIKLEATVITVFKHIFKLFKGTVNVIASDPSLKEWHIRFTFVP